jgi:hypothetical protein
MTPQEKLALLRAAATAGKETGDGATVGGSTALVRGSGSGIDTSYSTGPAVEASPTSTATASIPTTLSAFDQISNRIAELQISLAQQLPNYENILKVIHTALVKDEATVHLLSEEQIGIIVAGLCTKKHIVIAEAVKKNSSAASNKKLAATTVDDL